MTTLDVRVERFAECHVAPWARLSASAKGDAPMARPEHIRWKFLENPQGPAHCVHLWEDDELVGRLAAMPRRFTYRGRTYTAAYVVDLLVDPGHRGMGSLLRLIQGLKNLRERFDFVLVTPGDAGLPIWAHFVKMPARFDLALGVVPLRPARLTGKAFWPPARRVAPIFDWPWRILTRGAASLLGAVGGITIDENWPTHEELGRLCIPNSTVVVGQRDPDFLDWRFRRSPLFKYDVAFLRRGGALLGYVAGRRAVYAGYDAYFVVDAFGRPDLTRGDWMTAVWHSVRRAAQQGSDLLVLLANAGCGPARAMQQLPFLQAPERFRPQRATLFADWWSPAAFEFAADVFELTLADCDMF